MMTRFGGVDFAVYEEPYQAMQTYVDGLVQAFIDSRAEDIADEVPEIVSVMVSSKSLLDEVPVDVLAGALAVALVRLAARR